MSCTSIERGSIPCCGDTVSTESTFDYTFDFTFHGSEAISCDFPVPGTLARLILLNYNDVQKIYYSDIGVITSIVLRAGQAYEFFGFRQDVKKSEDVVNTRLKNRFRHSVEFVVYEVDQLQKNNLRKMAKGRFIAIIENNGKGADAIELLGRECGMKMVDGQLRNVHENGSVYTISLATPDNGVEFERKLPQTVGGNYTEGLSIIEGLMETPLGILLNEDGTPILREDGGYIYV